MGKYKLSATKEAKAIGAGMMFGSSFSIEGDLANSKTWTCKDTAWYPYPRGCVCIGLRQFGIDTFSSDSTYSDEHCGIIRMAGFYPSYIYTEGTEVSVLIVSNYSGYNAHYPYADLDALCAKTSCVEIR